MPNGWHLLMDLEPDPKGMLHFECGTTFHEDEQLEWMDDQLPKVRLPCTVCHLAAVS